MIETPRPQTASSEQLTSIKPHPCGEYCALEIVQPPTDGISKSPFVRLKREESPLPVVFQNRHAHIRTRFCNGQCEVRREERTVVSGIRLLQRIPLRDRRARQRAWSQATDFH